MAYTNNRFGLFVPHKDDDTQLPTNLRAVENWANKSGLLSMMGGPISSYSTLPQDNTKVKFFIQAGTFVGTPNASGALVIPYPLKFPNGVVTVMVNNGDQIPVAGTYAVTAVTTTSFTAIIYDTTAAAIPTPYTTITRVNYLVIGW